MKAIYIYLLQFILGFEFKTLEERYINTAFKCFDIGMQSEDPISRGKMGSQVRMLLR